jgi:hypothetical protein
MPRFHQVWVYDDRGRCTGRFLDVGYDPISKDLHNPNAYPPDQVRRAIARAEDERSARKDAERRAKRK